MRKNRAKRISIMLVDDQAEVRGSLRRCIDRDGRFDILSEAIDGGEALRRAALLKPDVMILDLAMPDVDGLDVLHRIKETSPDTKIAVLSSMVPFGGMRERLISLGAVAVFDKFVSPKKVIERLVAAHDDAACENG